MSKNILFPIFFFIFFLLIPKSSSGEEKKFYLTGSGGVGWLKDQDVNINSAYVSSFGEKVIDEFNSDLYFEVGVGYDFGKIRMEGTFSQGDNDLAKATTVGQNTYTEWTTGTVTNKAWNLGFYYDFKSHKKFTPYIGGGIGNTTLNVIDVVEKWNNESSPTTGPFETYTKTSYFGKVGMSYKMNPSSDLFLEGTYRTIGDVKRIVGTYPSPKTYGFNIGLRYRY